MLTLVALPERGSQLEHLLANEQWCRDYISWLRWPDGFTCGYCGNHNKTPGDQRPHNCCFCGRHHSITAGTVLHGTKKSVSIWLRGAWLVCSLAYKPSIREIQSKLTLKNYQTARVIFHKLNHANKYGRRCRGVVEIDGCEIFLNTNRTISSGCLVAALEMSRANNITGKLCIEFYHDFSPESLTHFLQKCVSPGSTLLLPARLPFMAFHSNDYHSLVEIGKSRHENTSDLLASCLNFCSKRSGADSSRKRLKADIDTFCFEINRKRFPDRLTLFEDFVANMLRQPPLSPASRSPSFAGSGGLL